MNQEREEKELLAQARWIFPNGDMYLHNSYALFRYDFQMDALPSREAPLLLSAEQSYRLYVNGHYCCRGPARGYPEKIPYDRVDIRPLLRRGHNFLGILVHTPGESNFSYRCSGRSGLICAAEWDNHVAIFSRTPSPAWKMKRVMAYRSDTAKYTLQMGFAEDFDAAREDFAFLFADAVPEEPGGQPEWTSRNGDQGYSGAPWFDMEPRRLLMLDEALSVPERLIGRGGGLAASGYRMWKNFVWPFVQQELSPLSWDAAPADTGTRDEDGFVFTLPASGNGRLALATLDLGADWLPGSLILSVTGGHAGEVVDVLYHHWLPDGKLQFVPPGAGSQISLGDRLRLGGAETRHEFQQVMGVRQFTVVARENASPLRIKAAFRNAVTSLRGDGVFHADDALLTEIYHICAHTQQACALDALVDTPWREQGEYIGDLRIQAENVRFMTGEHALIRRGIDLGIRQRTPEGLPYAVAPSVDSAPVIPDFTLTWILCLFDDYWWTGEIEPLTGYFQDARRILQYFETLRTPAGILRSDTRFWTFHDWGPLPRHPASSFMNLWHLYTLIHWEKLLRAAQCDAEADDVARRVAEERALLAGILLPREGGLIRPTLSDAGEPSGDPLVHDQVLALLCGLSSPEKMACQREWVRAVLSGNLPDSVIQPSSFWAYYLLECAAREGFRMEALAYIRRMWAKMIPCGTTWEVFDRGDYPGWSYSHAWSAHPLRFIPMLVAGLRQTAPGWSALEYQPDPALLQGCGHFTIPLPQGTLTFRWKDGKAALSLPPNIRSSTVQ